MTPEETARCSNKMARESKTPPIKAELRKNGKIITETAEIYTHVCTKNRSAKNRLIVFWQEVERDQRNKK